MIARALSAEFGIFILNLRPLLWTKQLLSVFIITKWVTLDYIWVGKAK